MRLLPELIRSWPKEVGGRSGFWMLFVLGLATLEVVGRFSSNDLEDFLAAACLILLVSALAFRHGRRSRSLLLAFRRRVQMGALRLAENWCDLEADLRRLPALGRGLPASQWKPTALIALAIPALYAFSWFVSIDLRRGVSDIFYVGYLGLLICLWGMMLMCGVVVALFAVTMLREIENPKQSMARRFPMLWRTGLVAVGVLSFAGFLFAPTYAIVISAFSWVVSLGLLLWPGGPRLDFAWKTGDPERPRCVADWSCFLAIHTSLLITLPVVVALLGGGPAVVHGWDHRVFEGMPVTSFMAICLSWLGAATGLMWCGVVLRLVIPGRTSDPSRFVPMKIDLKVPRGEVNEELRRLTRSLRGEVTLDDRHKTRDPDAVPLILDEGAEDYHFQMDWPLRVRRDDLGQVDLQARLDRRHAIQCRRLLLSRLEKLWKSVSKAKLDQGEGVLVAPHHWFTPGLTRDEGREEVGDDRLTWRSETLGTEYRKAIPHAARHHLFRCLEALEVDVIYVERGVQFRQLRRVMRILFDVYDMHGGKQPLDERDLSGIPGVRAVIHAFDFEEPFRSKVYPEPHYDGMGRARVLHLFRDRGEDEAPVDDPTEYRGKPVPLLFG